MDLTAEETSSANPETRMVLYEPSNLASDGHGRGFAVATVQEVQDQVTTAKFIEDIEEIPRGLGINEGSQLGLTGPMLFYMVIGLRQGIAAVIVLFVIRGTVGMAIFLLSVDLTGPVLLYNVLDTYQGTAVIKVTFVIPGSLGMAIVLLSVILTIVAASLIAPAVAVSTLLGESVATEILDVETTGMPTVAFLFPSILTIVICEAVDIRSRRNGIVFGDLQQSELAQMLAEPMNTSERPRIRPARSGSCEETRNDSRRYGVVFGQRQCKELAEIWIDGVGSPGRAAHRTRREGTANPTRRDGIVFNEHHQRMLTQMLAEGAAPPSEIPAFNVETAKPQCPMQSSPKRKPVSQGARGVRFMTNPVSSVATIGKEMGEAENHLAAHGTIQVQRELPTAGSVPSPSENLNASQRKAKGARNVFRRVGVKLGFGEHSKTSKFSALHVQTKHKHRPS